MIGYLKGRIKYKKPNQIILDVNGIGFLINISLSTYYMIEKKDEVELFIYTKVREDQIALYGFYCLEEKEIFEKLISISGIGPKAALTLLSGLSVDELYEAIEKQEANRLSRIPGIGNKTSERIVLEMKGKIRRKEDSIIPSLVPAQNEELRNDLINALINLGYNNNESKNVVDKVLIRNSTNDFALLLKESLRMLIKI